MGYEAVWNDAAREDARKKVQPEAAQEIDRRLTQAP